MKMYFQKILDGFLFGIGLSIPMTLAMSLAYYYSYNLSFSDNDIKELENYGLTFKENRIEKEKETAYIIGDIYNSNETSISSANIMAELKDANGKFIDKCTVNLNGVVKAKQTRNYKLECAPLLKPYSSYELTVPSAISSDLW